MTLSASLFRAALRQAVLGGVLAALTVPLVFGMSRAFGLGPPPLSGVLFLAACGVGAFALGGVGGAIIAQGYHQAQKPAGPGGVAFLACVAGLIAGGMLCGVVFPAYTEMIIDDVTEEGTTAAVSRAPEVIDKPSGAVDAATDAAGELAQSGMARLPALTLLAWTLMGPAIAAPLEARRRPRSPIADRV